MAKLLDAVVSFGWLQWLAVVFNTLYVIFAARGKRVCWIFGAIGVSLLFFIYVQASLYSDAWLQIFYLGMSVYGWFNWSKGHQHQAIKTASWVRHFQFIVAGFVASLLLGWFWSYFGAALPYVDAATSAFSVIATFMVAHKLLENWIYWIIIDLVCIGVYFERDLVLIALLFLVYTLLAIFGLYRWSIARRKQEMLQ